MTDRGLPIVDGAPACPFVAFEDDRDARALAPDHRHRCFAEPRPAPRALAHQEAYCLSSAFPVCPTFQDWARREAAMARPAAAGDRPHPEEPPASTPLPPRDREPRRAADTDTPPPLPPRRHQPRDWAAPPPWSEDENDAGAPAAGEAQPPGFLAGRAGDREDAARRAARGEEGWSTAARGLAGSAADRLAGPDPDAAIARPRPGRDVAADADGVGAVAADEAWAASRPRRPVDRGADRGAAPSASRDQVRRRREEEDASELFGPAWERPRRYEAYPTLRTRVGLPSLPGLWVAIAALVLAGVVLFFVGPMILGLGSKGPDTGAGASPSPSAIASPSPTLPPAPTPQLYVVAKNDTMSKIAKQFGVTVQQLLDANPKIKNPDKITIGDVITIPVPVASDVPDQLGGSTAP